MNKYISQSGFVKIPILRGFNFVEKLFDICKPTYKGGAFILGGYVRWMCSPASTLRTAGDIDIYCENQDVFDLTKTTLLNLGLAVKADNPMALTFEPHLDFPIPVQIIKPINQGAVVAAGSMETILSHFDFTVVRVGILDSQTALADADFIHDENNGLLRLKNIHCPITSTLRCMKYARKGYFLQPSECIKLFTDWDNRDVQYKLDILTGFKKIEGGEELTQEDIDHLEKLMRID